MQAAVLSATGLALALLPGCGRSDSDKAGGQPTQAPVVLTMAFWGSGTQELDRFFGEVTRLSEGTMRVDVRTSWRLGQRAYETGLIGDVRARKADLGVAGSRAWDSVGVKSLRPLHAPFLIDNYALEDRVVRSGLVKEMLEGLEPLGLVGLGVLPDGMRRPFGITTPLLKPADYNGLTIGTQQSRIADETMRAFGAKPVWFPVQGSINGFDGIEQATGSVAGNRYDTAGSYLTVNVSLWPRPLVLFANRKAFDALSREQQGILRQAVANAAVGVAAADRTQERADTEILCQRGLVSFVTASPADLAALRRAVQPVYDELERDPQTRRLIRQIAAMRNGIRPEAAPGCRASGQSVSQSSPLDGVYRVAFEGAPRAFAENFGTWTYVVDHGRFAFTQENKQACTWAYGTFSVRGQRVDWTITDGGGIAPNNALNKPGEFFSFGWSLYRDALTLTPIKGPNSNDISPMNFRVKPWHRISTTPSRRYFSKRCPPPAAALAR
jgi:TRAP-type C4-dicarboxylate transport system substrate-binding protein